MTDERDRPPIEPDDATGAFDADAWFRSQFGGEAPSAPAAPEPEPGPVEPPPADAAPAFAVPPLASAPPPSSAPVPLPPPPALVEPALRDSALFASAVPGPAPTEPAPTEPAPTEPAPIIEPEPTQPAEVVPPGTTIGDAATELIREPEPGEALDQLFGEQSFQEYDDALIPVVPRSERRAGRGAASATGDGTGGDAPVRAPLSQTQKVLLWVAGSLVALLALVAVFVLGTRIPLLLGPAPGAEPIASPEPSPSASIDARPTGPVAPGDWRWDELGGGECLEPFVDAWQEQFAVVDCATPHGGQLVLRAELPLAEGALSAGPYPGEQTLAAQALQLCSSPGVLDLGAAGAFTDIVLQAAFPTSEEAWDEGERDYFCFVSRSSGEALTASLVGPGPAPTALPTPAPGG